MKHFFGETSRINTILLADKIQENTDKAMVELARLLTDAFAEFGPEPAEVLWINILDQNNNPDGTNGFFRFRLPEPTTTTP